MDENEKYCSSCKQALPYDARSRPTLFLSRDEGPFKGRWINTKDHILDMSHELATSDQLDEVMCQKAEGGDLTRREYLQLNIQLWEHILQKRPHLALDKSERDPSEAPEPTPETDSFSTHGFRRKLSPKMEKALCLVLDGKTPKEAAREAGVSKVGLYVRMRALKWNTKNVR